MKTTNRLLAFLLALIMIISCAPLSIFAAETEAGTVSTTINPVADAYASKAYPDAATAGLYELRLNGGKNENIVFVSFKTSDFEGKFVKYLTLPVVNDAYVYADVYLIKDYCVNEEVRKNGDEKAFTYSNSIHLFDKTALDAKTTVLLCENKLFTQGDNYIFLPKLDKDELTEQEYGEYFTIALRADAEKEANVWTFDSLLKAFDDGSGADVDIFSKNGQDISETDEEGKIYSHGYSDKYRYYSPTATAMTYSKSTKTEASYYQNYLSVGAMNTLFIYNALSDSEITKDENGRVWTNGVEITDKTYRFTASITSNAGTTGSTPKRRCRVGVAPSYGVDFVNGGYSEFSEEYQGYYCTMPKSLTSEHNNSRVDLSLDYTVDAKHVKSEYVYTDEETGTKTTYYTYPMFYVIASLTTDMQSESAAHVCTHHVVELDKNGKERAAVFGAITVEQRTKGVITMENGVIYGDSPISFIASDKTKGNPLADTYVSATYPDRAFGFEDELLLNGGEKENIIFLSYPASVLDSRDDVFVTLPAGNDARVNAEVLLFDGELIEEATLTYKNMPDLANAVPLGTTTIEGELPSVNISEAKGEVKGEYFTIALRSTDDVHSYNEGFEDSAVGVKFSEPAKLDSNENGLSDGCYADNNFAIEVGGSGSGCSWTPVVDDENESSILLKAIHVKDKTPRISFYNTVSYYTLDTDGKSVKANGVEIAGKTYCFTARVKASALDESASLIFCAAPMDAKEVHMATTNATAVSVPVNTEWQTVTVKYTVGEQLFSSEATSAEDWTPPAGEITFGYYLSGHSAETTLYIDDIRVAELTNDGKEKQFVMCSLDGAQAVDETSYIQYVPHVAEGFELMADAYVSDADPNTALGATATEFKLRGGSNDAILATYEVGDMDANDIINLTIPVTKATGVEVFVLDGASIDETVTYNTMPALTDENSVGTFSVDADNNTVKLGRVGDLVKSNVFTVAIRALSNNVIYSEDFTGYTSDMVLSERQKIDADATNDVPEERLGYYEGEKAFVMDFGGSNVPNRENNPYIAQDSGNDFLVLMTKPQNTSTPRYIIYNTISDSEITTRKNAETGDVEVLTNGVDITGKTYRFYADIKAEGDVSTFKMGTSRTNVDEIKHSTINITNDWQRFCCDYTVNADDVSKVVTTSKGDYITYPIFGFSIKNSSDENPLKYHFDNLKVVELVDDALVIDSSEVEGGNTLNLEAVSVLDGNMVVIKTTVAPGFAGSAVMISDNGKTYSLLDVKSGKLMVGGTNLVLRHEHDVEGDYEVGENGITVDIIYNDKDGTVRYAIGDALAYYVGADGEVHATFGHEAVNGGVSADAELIVLNEADRVSVIKNSTSEIIGGQTHATEYKVRLISGVDSYYYNEVGFEIESAKGTASNKFGSKTVYSSALGADKEFNASDEGYENLALLAVNFENHKEGDVLKVTPYLRVGEYYVYGDKVYCQVTIENNQISMAFVEESVFTAAKKDANAEVPSEDDSLDEAYDPEAVA